MLWQRDTALLEGSSDNARDIQSSHPPRGLELKYEVVYSVMKGC